MTSNVAKLTPRGSLPHLPEIARDPLDDAREALAAFKAWQAGDGDMSRAELADALGTALQGMVAIIARPRRRELPAWKRLPVEQARQYIDQLAALPRETEPDCARQLGRLEVHAARLLDVIDSEVSPW